MKTKMRLLLIAVLLSVPANAADEQVEVRDLPPAVQQTLERWRAEGPVKQATRQMLNGRAVYYIEIEKNNAPNPRLRIAEDGTLVKDPAVPLAPIGDGFPVVTDEYGGVVAPTFPKLNLDDLPSAVQQTARTEAAGREIVDIERETWNGRSVYEIEFKQRGFNARIYVDNDGTLVRDERRPGEALKSLFMGTQLTDTPPPVQATIRRVADDREIADIDRKTGGAQPVYRVEIKSDQGMQELHVAEDGTILYDSLSPREQRPAR
jgi:uncharacterized membrane protein YkoI